MPCPEVMLIEDDADIRDTMCDLLSLEGYRIESASNGQEALQKLQNADSRPHVILLDLMMPVMDGWEFRRMQLLDDTLADIPTIVISGDANVSGKARALGATGWLLKPVELDEFLETVKGYCGSRE